MKGTKYERNLEATLREYGFATLRAPGSGTGPHNRPDVFAIKTIEHGRQAFGFELKASKDGNASFKEAEIDDLKAWCDKGDVAAYVGISPDKRKSEHDSDYYVHIDDLHETKQGNYSFRHKRDESMKLAELLR